MSTRIEINVNRQALIQAAQQNQAANRLGFIAQQARQSAGDAAAAEVAASRADRGEDPAGQRLGGRRVPTPRVTPRPTANRVLQIAPILAVWTYYAGDGGLWVRGAEGGEWAKVGNWAYGFYGDVLPVGTLNDEYLPGRYEHLIDSLPDFTDVASWARGSTPAVETKDWSPTYGDKETGEWYPLDKVTVASPGSAAGTGALPIAFGIKHESDPAKSALWYHTSDSRTRMFDQMVDFYIQPGSKAGEAFIAITEDAYAMATGFCAGILLEADGATVQAELRLTRTFSESTSATKSVFSKVGKTFASEPQADTAYAAVYTPYNVEEDTLEPDGEPLFQEWYYGPVQIRSGLVLNTENTLGWPDSNVPPALTAAETITALHPWPLASGRLYGYYAAAQALYPFLSFNWLQNRRDWVKSEAISAGDLTVFANSYSYTIPRVVAPEFSLDSDGVDYSAGWDFPSLTAADVPTFAQGPGLLKTYQQSGYAAGTPTLRQPLPEEGGWAAVATSGGFSLTTEPGESNYSASFFQRVMDTGFLAFEHTGDGRKVRVKIGGSAEGPVDTNPDEGFYELYLTSTWDQAATCAAIASSLGYT